MTLHVLLCVKVTSSMELGMLEAIPRHRFAVMLARYASAIRHSLKLYLPRVEMLNLAACYGLVEVKLLKKEHGDHAAENLPAEEHSKFLLGLANENVG